MAQAAAFHSTAWKYAGESNRGTKLPWVVISTLMAIDDHSVLNARIVRPSGNAGWDNAAVRAVQKSDPMPRGHSRIVSE
ncbi:TonB C-terminal domain-containing protein [Paraburkholderia hospita]|uniref:TonB C-terminal domain-containing protein n=1 Tax=Paraburkholderia hospita TaxID=169430 RepID=UPI0009A8F635|nr:TonB C-terminal domain-containing protein [Paraburkholderia hospita]